MNIKNTAKPTNKESASQRKLIERALFLPLIGLLLFLPPIAGIFDINLFVSGIPFTVIYIFVVWGLLIFAAYRLSRRLTQMDEPETETIERQPGAQREQQ